MIAVTGRLDAIGPGRGAIPGGAVTVICRVGAVAMGARSERIDLGFGRLAAARYLAKIGLVVPLVCFLVAKRRFVVAMVSRLQPRLGFLVPRPRDVIAITTAAARQPVTLPRSTTKKARSLARYDIEPPRLHTQSGNPWISDEDGQ